MGQQQLLLIILGVIIVGIAIAVGLSLFSANSTQANKDAIINDINNIGANGYQYRIRPASMGGGGGSSYVGYTIPFKMSSNDNATYTAAVTAPTIIITGTSTRETTTSQVIGTLDANGKMTFTPASTAFTGNFQ
jgi:flagellar basal body-associated protein FliL